MSDTVLVIGAGDATGAAIVEKFAAEGLTVIAARRPVNADKLSALAAKSAGHVIAMPVDARDEDSVIALFEHIESEVGPLSCVIFNIGANVYFPIEETTSRVYRKVWEMGAYAGFLVGREAARVMRPRGQGTILFTGATASIHGSSGFSAFSGAKFALRALAQSMARELGPEGIHVAHLVVDSAIDTQWIAENFPDRYALGAQDGLVKPEDIAELYWQLHQQPRSGWVHELDLRPYMEKF